MKLDIEHSFFCGLGDVVIFAWVAEGLRGTGNELSFYAPGGWRADVLRLFGQEVTADPACAMTITRPFADDMEEGTALDYMEWIAEQICPGCTPIRPCADFIPFDRHFGRQMARDVLLFPQTTDQARQWPVAYWIDLANLLRMEGLNVALVLNEFEGRYQCSPVPVIHGQSIERIAAAMQTSKLVIGNDSGPAHLAGTLGTPTIAIQGSTTERIFSYLPEVTSLRDLDLPCSGCHGAREQWRPACGNGCQALFRLFPDQVARFVMAEFFVKETA